MRLPISGIYDTRRFSGQVPDVADLTEKEACEQLWRRHFNIAKILRKHSDTVAAGYAIRTAPPAGAQVREPNIILYVSEEIGASATHSVSADAMPATVASGNTNQSMVAMAGSTSKGAPVWRALLLVYASINVDYVQGGVRKHLTLTLSMEEIDPALRSFRAFPAIAKDYSQGHANVRYDIMYVSRPIDSVTSRGAPDDYWISPADTRQELDEFAPAGRYDSVLVLWPETDPATGQSIPSGGWGLGMGASTWSNGATYATIANAAASIWQMPTVGEVWLHEWLHGVCDYYAGKCYAIPEGGPDGGGLHGYVHSDTEGWAAYYRDLMTGRVRENGTDKGITAVAWDSGTILSKR